MRLLIISFLLITISCAEKKNVETVEVSKSTPEDLIAVLDTIWFSEQIPISKRDSLMDIYGAESKEVLEQQNIYEKNHVINELKIRAILDKEGWPDPQISGNRGNMTICNVLQHSDMDVRVQYLPMMKRAVLDHKLEARFLVRAEDRIATDKNENIQ